jgi:hypothetical protein
VPQEFPFLEVGEKQSLNEASRPKAAKRKLYILSHQWVSVKLMASMFIIS